MEILKTIFDYTIMEALNGVFWGIGLACGWGLFDNVIKDRFIGRIIPSVKKWPSSH